MAHSTSVHKDLYALDPADVVNPPQELGAILRKIGPGMILAASIVGSGELIATTTLGAEVGYVCLWVIILSCLIKPVIQAELGRYSISTGETGLAGLNQVPGPRVAKVGWVVWGWALMICFTRFQIGAMFGGVAQVLFKLTGIGVNYWVIALLGITLALLLGGGYERIEGLATIKVGLFTMLTFMSALMLMRNSQDFSWNDIMEGLKFHLPESGLTTAIAVFGITGVGAAELFMYPYWCVEKGYARFAGRRDASVAWRGRALGWIKVMHVDILASMVIYTVATLAFYLLGAGILNKRGLKPSSGEMIDVLSKMYTQTLGEWALPLFYIGAVATLYGTIFAATAAESRVAADLCRLLGKFDSTDYDARLRYRKIFVVILTSVSAGFYLIVQSPVAMVKAGGVAQASMLPIIAIAALFLRYKKLPREIFPAQWITITLWISSIATVSAMAYYVFLLVKPA